MEILFLGETAGGSAEYVRDSLLEFKHVVTHVDSRSQLPPIQKTYPAIIISDYSSSRINAPASKKIIESVEQGSRLVMIGGWESFNGKGQSYFNHPIAEILPVNLDRDDDRRNYPQGLILSPDPAVASLSKLDWSHPPVICGYNHADPKPGSKVLVWMKPIDSDGTTIAFGQAEPLVIRRSHSRGIVIACLTDLAPHWCGGLVDWGTRRLKLSHVEVGDLYPHFVQFLLTA